MLEGLKRIRRYKSRGGSAKTRARAGRGGFTAAARYRAKARLAAIWGASVGTGETAKADSARYAHAARVAEVSGVKMGAAVGELNAMCESLATTPADLVRECTEAMHADAVARWEATAGMSKRNTRDRSGAFRTTHRSQRYRGAIQKTYFDSGMTGAVFVAPDDYAGRLEEWESTLLPVWLEYGTWRAKGRPHLIPAFQAAKTRFDRLIERFVAALAQVR